MDTTRLDVAHSSTYLGKRSNLTGFSERRLFADFVFSTTFPADWFSGYWNLFLMKLIAGYIHFWWFLSRSIANFLLQLMAPTDFYHSDRETWKKQLQQLQDCCGWPLRSLLRGAFVNLTRGSVPIWRVLFVFEGSSSRSSSSRRRFFRFSGQNGKNQLVPSVAAEKLRSI